MFICGRCFGAASNQMQLHNQRRLISRPTL